MLSKFFVRVWVDSNRPLQKSRQMLILSFTNVTLQIFGITINLVFTIPVSENLFT